MLSSHCTSLYFTLKFVKNTGICEVSFLEPSPEDNLNSEALEKWRSLHTAAINIKARLQRES
jgi:hypothetical protein